MRLHGRQAPICWYPRACSRFACLRPLRSRIRSGSSNAISPTCSKSKLVAQSVAASSTAPATSSSTRISPASTPRPQSERYGQKRQATGRVVGQWEFVARAGAVAGLSEIGRSGDAQVPPISLMLRAVVGQALGLVGERGEPVQTILDLLRPERRATDGELRYRPRAST